MAEQTPQEQIASQQAELSKLAQANNAQLQAMQTAAALRNLPAPMAAQIARQQFNQSYSTMTPQIAAAQSQLEAFSLQLKQQEEARRAAEAFRNTKEGKIQAFLQAGGKPLLLEDKFGIPFLKYGDIYVYNTSKAADKIRAAGLPTEKSVTITPESKISDLLKQGLSKEQIFQAGKEFSQMRQQAAKAAAQAELRQKYIPLSPIESQMQLNQMKLTAPSEFIKIVAASKAAQTAAQQTSNLEAAKAASGIKTDYVKMPDGRIIPTDQYIQESQKNFDKTIFGLYNKFVTKVIEPAVQKTEFTPKTLLAYAKEMKISYDPSADLKLILFSPLLFSDFAAKKGSKQVTETKTTKAKPKPTQEQIKNAEIFLRNKQMLDPQYNRNAIAEVYKRAIETGNKEIIKNAQKLYENALGKEAMQKLFADVAQQEGFVMAKIKPPMSETEKAAREYKAAMDLFAAGRPQSFQESTPLIVGARVASETAQSIYQGRGQYERSEAATASMFKPAGAEILNYKPLIMQTTDTSQQFKPALSISSMLMTSQALKNLQDQAAALKSEQISQQILNQLNLLKAETAQASGFKFFQPQIQPSLSMTSQTAAQQYITSQKSAQMQKEIPLLLKPRSKFRSKDRPFFRPQPQKRQSGFDIAIKSKGKFSLLPAPFSFSYKAARAVAEKRLLGSLSATAELIPSRKPLRKVLLTPTNESLFRSPIVRGRETFDPFKIIQKQSGKAGGRLVTIAERKEIQQARKSKPSKSKIKTKTMRRKIKIW